MYRVKPYYRNDIKGVFDLFDDFFTDSHVVRGNFKIDVKDLKDKYVVEAELPGLLKEDVSITFENDNLVIRISKENVKDEETKYIHKERYSFKSERKIYLPEVDPTKLRAKFENGVLVITLEKLENKINKYMIDIE